MKDPQILILDEATAALDALSEHYVQKAMDDLMQGRTAIVIAHRLATIANADQIVVMDQGTIAEQGNHQDLLAKGGLYSQLYHTQFKLAQEQADSTELETALSAEVTPEFAA